MYKICCNCCEWYTIERMEKKTSRKEEPEVEIFGQPVGLDEKCCENENWKSYHWHHHNHHYGSGIWGVFFIWAGVMLLLNTLNIVPWTFWNYIRDFWPVLIILIGLRFVLGRNCVSRFVTTILALLVAGYVMIYALDMMHSPLLNTVPPNILNSVRSVASMRK
jgi:hypothetical protein